MVAPIHVNQRVKLPNEVKASREACKVYKNVREPQLPAICRATPEVKQIYHYALENGMTNLFLSRESSIGQPSGDELQNETQLIRIGQQGIVLCDHCMARPFFLLLIFVVAEKRKNMVWTCEAMCKGNHGGRLAQCVGQPEHWSTVADR